MEEVDGAMENLWTILDDTALLLSCENLNGLYQAAVYDNLCAKLPEGLLAFWVSAVILTVLLLVLVSLVIRNVSSLSPSLACTPQHSPPPPHRALARTTMAFNLFRESTRASFY